MTVTVVDCAVWLWRNCSDIKRRPIADESVWPPTDNDNVLAQGSIKWPYPSTDTENCTPSRIKLDMVLPTRTFSHIKTDLDDLCSFKYHGQVSFFLSLSCGDWDVVTLYFHSLSSRCEALSSRPDSSSWPDSSIGQLKGSFITMQSWLGNCWLSIKIL